MVKYSYEFKCKCVELYRQGKWPEMPEDAPTLKGFHNQIRRWAKTAEANGSCVLQHTGKYKEWTPEEKLELVNRVLDGNSLQSVAENAGINSGMLCGWMRKYRELGYNGLINNKPKGRPTMNKQPRKETEPRELTESEREELIRLKERVAYLEAENAVIKKRIALRQKETDEKLKAKKQRSSGNSGSRDTN